MAQVTKEVQEIVCDVCGEHADGEYYEVTYLNGEVFAEMYCPLDLCKNHMKVFATQFSNHAYERYDGKDNTEELIRKMKHYVEVDEGNKSEMVIPFNQKGRSDTTY